LAGLKLLESLKLLEGSKLFKSCICVLNFPKVTLGRLSGNGDGVKNFFGKGETFGRFETFGKSETFGRF
ncbi:MAG: hypothetical protein ABI416_02765, partial [Ginsengibacter sp.]